MVVRLQRVDNLIFCSRFVLFIMDPLLMLDRIHGDDDVSGFDALFKSMEVRYKMKIKSGNANECDRTNKSTYDAGVKVTTK